MTTVTGATVGGRVWGGMSAAEREARRREQFLEAGLDVFASAGWNDATVAAICRAAHLSQRYFYELFESREALLIAITEQIAADVEHVIRDGAEIPGTPEERARRIVVALAEHFATDPRVVRVALVESLATAPMRAHRAKLLESFTALGARLMRSLHPTPDRADPESLQLSAAVLAGGIVEVLIAAVTERQAVDADRLLDHVAELYRVAASLA
jgi:AcrR family transcriptional regulator